MNPGSDHHSPKLLSTRSRNGSSVGVPMMKSSQQQLFDGGGTGNEGPSPMLLGPTKSRNNSSVGLQAGEAAGHAPMLSTRSRHGSSVGLGLSVLKSNNQLFDGGDGSIPAEPTFSFPGTAAPSKSNSEEPGGSASSQFPRKLNQYILLRELGRGSYGCVYEAIVDSATNKENNNNNNNESNVVVTHFALKELSKSRLLKQQQQQQNRFRAPPPTTTPNGEAGGMGRGRGRGFFAMMKKGGPASPNPVTPSEPPSSTSPATNNDQDRWAFCREIAILKKIRHPHIVRLHEVLDDPKLDLFYMVFDLCPLGPVIRIKSGERVNPLPFNRAVKYLKQLVHALAYLHQNGIVHRDIKPDNVLLKSEDCVQLVDFGVARSTDSEQQAGGNSGTKETSTIAFQPPETWPNLFNNEESDQKQQQQPDREANTDNTPVIVPIIIEAEGNQGQPAPLSESEKAKAADCWALGCTLYTMLFGRLPFDGNGEGGGIMGVIERIKTSRIEWNPAELNIPANNETTTGTTTTTVSSPSSSRLELIRDILIEGGLLKRKPIQNRYSASKVLDLLTANSENENNLFHQMVQRRKSALSLLSLFNRSASNVNINEGKVAQSGVGAATLTLPTEPAPSAPPDPVLRQKSISDITISIPDQPQQPQQQREATENVQLPVVPASASELELAERELAEEAADIAPDESDAILAVPLEKISEPDEQEIRSALTNVSSILATINAAIKFKKGLLTNRRKSVTASKIEMESVLAASSSGVDAAVVSNSVAIATSESMELEMEKEPQEDDDASDKDNDDELAEGMQKKLHFKKSSGKAKSKHLEHSASTHKHNNNNNHSNNNNHTTSTHKHHHHHQQPALSIQGHGSRPQSSSTANNTGQRATSSASPSKFHPSNPQFYLPSHPIQPAPPPEPINLMVTPVASLGPSARPATTSFGREQRQQPVTTNSNSSNNAVESPLAIEGKNIVTKESEKNKQQ